MEESFDVIVVGAGACGGMAAQRLTKLGLRVLVLEAGPKRDSVEADRIDATSAKGHRAPGKLARLAVAGKRTLKAAWQDNILEHGHLRAAPQIEHSRRQPVQARCLSYSASNAHLFIDDVDNPYMTPSAQRYSWIRGRQVGGRMHLWTRGAPRIRDIEFEAPSRAELDNVWPLRTADLQKHYEHAERLLQVRGAVEAGAPAYAGALPVAAFDEEESGIVANIEEQLHGLRTVRFPWAENSGTQLTDAADEVRVNAIATEVLVDGRRARGVRYRDALDLSNHEVFAPVVMLCASALESTRLLLLSSSEAWPTGLANSSGVLGHYLMDHLFGVGALGISNLPPSQVSHPPLYVHPFRNIDEASRQSDFEGSYQLLIMRGAHRPAPFRRYRRTLNVSAQGEVSSSYSNKVSLDRSVLDAFGVPVLRIEAERSENELAMERDMIVMCERVVRCAGYKTVLRSPHARAPGDNAHEMGTARMGANSASSVVNSYGQSWDIPNLYVTDGSVFPTSACQNPTITMMAVTSRACDHVADNLASYR